MLCCSSVAAAARWHSHLASVLRQLPAWCGTSKSEGLRGCALPGHLTRNLKDNSASVKGSRGLKSPKLSLGWMLLLHPSGPNRHQAPGFNLHLDNDGNLKICSFKNCDRRSFHPVWLQDLPARKQGELLVNCFWWGRKAQSGHPKC